MKIYFIISILLNVILLYVMLEFREDRGTVVGIELDLRKEIERLSKQVYELDKNTREKLLCEKHIEAEVDPYFGTPMKTKEILCSEEVVKVLGGKYYKVIKTLKKTDDKIEYRVKEI